MDGSHGVDTFLTIAFAISCDRFALPRIGAGPFDSAYTRIATVRYAQDDIQEVMAEITSRTKASPAQGSLGHFVAERARLGAEAFAYGRAVLIPLPS